MMMGVGRIMTLTWLDDNASRGMIDDNHLYFY